MTDDAFVYFEDIAPGQTFHAGPVTVTQEGIIAFAKDYDPQDFHTDPVKAKDTAFGELVSSGWYTAALTMRMMTEGLPKVKGGLVGRAVEKINWPRPVRPGDAISLTVTVLETRVSQGNPQRGVVRTKNVVTNQRGEPVMEMEVIMSAPRKTA